MKGTCFVSKGRPYSYFGLLIILTVVVIPAYADQTIEPSSGGTIDVGFQTDPANPTPGNSQTNLEVSFINKSTHSVQPHIDYKVSVMEGNNQICGTGLQHTAEGTVTVPCALPDPTTYQIVVEVDGILFQPIPPETATFTINLGGASASTNSTSSSTSTSSNSTASSSTSSNSTTSSQLSGTLVIPSWIKNNAKWWSEGQVRDSDFVKGIQYLIQQGIMKVPAQSASSTTSTTQPIPSWIKTNAGWWAEGQISDQDFVKGIQWLVANGIIVV